jgi:hypothetical protein
LAVVFVAAFFAGAFFVGIIIHPLSVPQHFSKSAAEN